MVEVPGKRPQENAQRQEMKVATIYEGWKSDRTRSSLVGKKVIAGMEKSEEFHKKREAQIRSIYNGR